jgi:hypothetical protein
MPAGDATIWGRSFPDVDFARLIALTRRGRGKGERSVADESQLRSRGPLGDARVIAMPWVHCVAARMGGCIHSPGKYSRWAQSRHEFS